MPQDYDLLSKDQLVELLKRRDSERPLGVVWERNEIEHDRAINSEFVLLDQVPELSSGTGPKKNLIIEADNFDALRWLRMTHRRAVKCIYIDPPYNTRNKSFVYNDDFVAPDDRFVHSKWLEYMYQRLLLAQDLLAPDGLLFVSIDDGEVARLRMLMDMLFPNGFMACLIWQSDGKFDNQAKFKVNHEYVLVYALDKESVPAPPVLDPNMPESSKLFNQEIRNAITKNGPKNPISKITLPIGFPTTFEAGLIRARHDTWPRVLNDAAVFDHHLTEELTLESGWSSKTLCLGFINNDFAPVRDDKDQLTSFVLTQHGVIEYFKPRSSEQSYVLSVIRNVGTTETAKNRLKKIGVVFDYPKPVNLIKYLLKMVAGNNYTVLDFFAGTGTTGEAVKLLNDEDHGSRNFILVSSTEATKDEPSKNICRDACAKRMTAVFSETSANSTASELFGYKYLRAALSTFGDIDVELSAARTWLIIQAAHGVSIANYDASALLQIAAADDVALIYIDKISEPSLGALRHEASGRRSIVYSWAPGQLRECLFGEDVELRQLPGALLDRFRR